MSPEQAEGRHDDVGPATDLFAMGAILYEMATGDLAFEGASMPAVLYRICSKDADRVDGSRVDAPLRFTELIANALTRELPKRVARADVFRARLREALDEVGGNVRYTDRMAAPAVRPTPLTLSMEPPTPNRKKRQTGAHDVTLASQETPVAASLTPAAAGQISASTYIPPRRAPLLLALVAALAGAMIVAVVVVALTRTGQPASSSQKLVEPVAVPPPPIDAAPIGIDAYVAPEPPTPTLTPTPTPTPKHVKPKPEPSPAPIEKPVVPPEPPKKKGCEQYDKGSKEYTMCVMGDGT